MREKRHTREGAVGVRERGIYIYIYNLSERKGGCWCEMVLPIQEQRKRRRKKNKETKEMEFSAAKKRLGRMFWVGHVSC